MKIEEDNLLRKQTILEEGLNKEEFKDDYNYQ